MNLFLPSESDSAQRALSTMLFPTPTRYVDGQQYCSKSTWFSRNPDDYPAPFNNAFHIEMGVEPDGRDGGSSGGANDGGGLSMPERALHSPSVISEMLVDYVRITQVCERAFREL